jgi:hypothetical protein
LKKHKTTVLLIISLHETLDFAQEKLLQALKSRALHDINGDLIPDDSFDIEFGVPMDRTNLEKGWMRIETDPTGLDDESAPKKNKGKSKNGSPTLMELGIQNGHVIAFRFRKPDGENVHDGDLDVEDPGWDVEIPSIEDMDEEDV